MLNKDKKLHEISERIYLKLNKNIQKITTINLVFHLIKKQLNTYKNPKSVTEIELYYVVETIILTKILQPLSIKIKAIKSNIKLGISTEEERSQLRYYEYQKYILLEKHIK